MGLCGGFQAPNPQKALGSINQLNSTPTQGCKQTKTLGPNPKR